ncbi:MAG: PIN domain-containing protein [Defluviitaleaceae bacterium]|nr:PIN domain-containing protein [Defluviitaleaceae bacterium]
MRALLDTNVILDFFLLREPFLDDADRIFEMVRKKQIQAFTTASSITDIYFIAAKRLGISSAREIVRDLLKIVKLIAVDYNDCATALDLPMSDFEDALIVTCASKEGVDVIVSNDKEFVQAGKNLAIVVSSQTFIDQMFNAV